MTEAEKTVRLKFEKALSDFSMLRGIQKIAVGFSGGADSALLLTLLSSRPGLSVAAAHVHHGIRGEEADRDEAFCREFCLARGIPFFPFHADVPRLAKARKAGLEETAREVRYSFFDTLLSTHGFDAVATAHTASDNAETLLFRFIRGTGTDGLCGIPPVRGAFLRPLILCTKEEVLACCRALGIPFVEDSTNRDTDYTRNYIRHILLPAVKKLNPSFEKNSSSFSSAMSADRDYLNEQAKAFSFADGRAALSSLPPALLSRVLLRELRSSGLSPEGKHLRLVAEALASGAAHLSLSLPGGAFFLDRDQLFALPSSASPSFREAGRPDLGESAGVAPGNNGFASEINGLAPETDGHAPGNNAPVPKTGGFATESNDHASETDGLAPENDGLSGQAGAGSPSRAGGYSFPQEGAGVFPSRGARSSGNSSPFSAAGNFTVLSQNPVKLLPGLTRLGDDSAVFLALPGASSAKDINMMKNIYKLSIHVSVDSAKIDVITMRGRKPGDTFCFCGMRRKVKKLLQSKKLTLQEKASLPFFLMGEEIVWIPGFPPGEALSPSSSADQPATLYYLRGRSS